MSEHPSDNTEHGYTVSPKEKTDCDRCGDEKVIAVVERCRPALCTDCEQFVKDLNAPNKEREITPMDKRWR